MIRSTAALLGAVLVVTSIVLLTNGNSGEGPPGPVVVTTQPSSSAPSSQPSSQPSAPPSAPPSSAPVVPPTSAPVVPPTTPAPGPARTPATAALLDRVPDAIRPSCSDGDMSRFPPSVTAVVACTPPGGFPVIYAQFVDNISMSGGFDRLLSGGEITHNACDPSVPLGGRQKYKVGGKTVGDLACYETSDGDVYLTWSSEDLNIVAEAHAPFASYGRLCAWWVTAGPLHGRDTGTAA
ncbi:hypothetical protein [Streptomyces hiroshimensis]|uniref:hypothetical protein n=1 Tax=Streptomyces hiroshimensis TaxID=66424 RepID=UPI0016756708|nr:hypothetical protein [Streptomyces hiroshimensis]